MNENVVHYCPHCFDMGRESQSRDNEEGEWCRACEGGYCDCDDCMCTGVQYRCAQIIQALTRGILTRRKIHFALLSADPDALERIM